jgi:hypothetical protein
MKFPIYRKYINERHFFKVLDERHFEEIRKIGARTTLSVVAAERFPEIQFVRELIDCSNSVAITEEEYDEHYRKTV